VLPRNTLKLEDEKRPLGIALDVLGSLKLNGSEAYAEVDRRYQAIFVKQDDVLEKLTTALIMRHA
jgi:hypothetical protein